MNERWGNRLPYLLGIAVSGGFIWYDWAAVSALFTALLRLSLPTILSLGYFIFLAILPALSKSN